MLSELEAGLGYTFRDKSILENALTHSSYANENRERGLRDNERLEFLGDSILGFVVADYLYRSFPDKPEGELTRIRADLVCEKNLARAAGTISLGSFLLLGHGEEHGGGRKRDSIVSDAMESVIAASYMDGGFSAAKQHKRRAERCAGVHAEQRGVCQRVGKQRLHHQSCCRERCAGQQCHRDLRHARLPHDKRRRRSVGRRGGKCRQHLAGREPHAACEQGRSREQG